MKRFVSLLIALVTLAAQVQFITPKADALGTNLITNPSLESVSPTNSSLPSAWNKEKWGSNTTTLSYLQNGYTGTRSVQVKMTTYKSGDAKWYFAPVAVTPNTSYTFSDYYISTVATELVVMITSTSGAVTYRSIKTVPISSTWKQVSATYTSGANVKEVTVFHLLKKVGTLQIDDAYFGLTNTPAPTAPSVSITAPISGATVSDVITATASASDAVSISGVQFKVDGANLGSEDTSAPYSVVWDTKTIANGNHVMTATARNSSGLSTTSSAVNIVVINPVAPTPPTVSISEPLNNSQVSGSVNIAASASDAVAVAGVQFKLDGVNLGMEDTTAPYSIVWDTTAYSNGSHTLSAVARNSQGLNTTSSQVTVNVNNTVVTPPIDQENLVLNPSVEASTNNTTPDKWLSNKWGTNSASFAYDSSAHSGSKSIRTTVSSYTNGDAKWYFEPVAITASKNYIYRDYYKSTAPSRIVAAFLDQNGTYSYKDLGTVATATSWSLFEATITMPANANKVTVFHILESVGSLNIDDVLLQVAVPVPSDINVPNGSFETGSTTPLSWSGNSWGSNSSVFSYITTEGYSGTRSAKVTVSSYVSGDAKWFFEPIKTLSPGSQYRFTTWYKGTVQPHVVALYIDANNVEHYVGLPNPLSISSTVWQKYSDTFTVPLGTTSVSIFMYVQENGWLQTDDYSITTYHPNGFNRPLLTLTFDDGHEDNATNALPLLNQYGIKSTQCYATTFIEGQNQAVKDGVMAFVNSGHEICSHTVTHPFMTTLAQATLDYELSHSKSYLETLIGKPILNFASPYGDYNANVINAVDDYYQSHRTVDEGFNSKDNFDPYRLRVQNILDTTTSAQVQAWIQQAQADNTWLILVYHRVASNPGPYDTYTDVFQQHLQAISASGIKVSTLQDAITEVRSQL